MNKFFILTLIIYILIQTAETNSQKVNFIEKEPITIVRNLPEEDIANVEAATANEEAATANEEAATANEEAIVEQQHIITKSSKEPDNFSLAISLTCSIVGGLFLIGLCCDQSRRSRRKYARIPN